MAKEILDKIQVIDEGNIDILLLGNKIGYIPLALPIDSTISWEVKWAFANGVGPLESSIDDIMRFIGVKDVSLEVKLKRDEFYTDVNIDNKHIGEYHLDEVLMYLFSQKTSISCEKDILATEDYDKYKQDNMSIQKIFQKKKIPYIPLPNRLTKFEIIDVTKNYLLSPTEEQDDDIEKELEYVFHSENEDGYSIGLRYPAEETPNSVLPFLEKEGVLSNDDIYIQKSMGAYSSLKKILKKYNVEVSRVIFHDKPIHNSGKQVFLLSNMPTVSLELVKDKTVKSFVVPHYIYMPFVLEKKEFYIPFIPSHKKVKNNDTMYA